MLKWVVILFFVIIIKYLHFFFLKRSKIKRLDELEKRKIELKKLPILDEFIQLRKKGVQGETELKIVQLRGRIDNLLDNDFKEIEMIVFEAEEVLKKNNFKNFDKFEKKAHEGLTEIEEKINVIISETENLQVTSEENEEGILKLKNQFRELKKSVIIHSHFFRKAMSVLEIELDSEIDSFAEVEQKNSDRDFFAVSNILKKSEVSYKKLEKKVAILPDLYQKCDLLQTTQFVNLKKTWNTLKSEGYPLSHVNFDVVMFHLEGGMEDVVNLLDSANTEDAAEKYEKIVSVFSQLHNKLNHEVDAVAFINTSRERLDDQFNDFLSVYNIVLEEAEKANIILFTALKNGNDQINLKVIIEDLKTYWDEVCKSVVEKKAPCIVISHKIKSFEKELNDCGKMIYEFQERIKNLKEVEIKTKNKLSQLRQELKSVGHILNQVNVTHVPEQMLSSFELTRKSIDDINRKIQEKPFTSEMIQDDLDKTIKQVELANTTALEFVVEIKLIEKLIQYSNRYRITHPDIASKLTFAEDLFTKGRYRKTLACVLNAIDVIDNNYLQDVSLNTMELNLINKVLGKRSSNDPISKKEESAKKVAKNQMNRVSELEKITQLSTDTLDTSEDEDEAVLFNDSTINLFELPNPVSEEESKKHAALKLLIEDIREHEENFSIYDNTKKDNIEDTLEGTFNITLEDLDKIFNESPDDDNALATESGETIIGDSGEGIENMVVESRSDRRKKR